MGVFSLDTKQNNKAIGQGALSGGGQGALSGAATGAMIGAAGGPGGALIGAGIGAAIGAAGGAGIGAAESGVADASAQKDKFAADQDLEAAKADATIDAQALARSGGPRRVRRAPNAALAYLGDAAPGQTSYDEWKVGA